MWQDHIIRCGTSRPPSAQPVTMIWPKELNDLNFELLRAIFTCRALTLRVSLLPYHTRTRLSRVSSRAGGQDRRLELESDFTQDNDTDLPRLRFHFVVDCLTRHVNWLDTQQNTSTHQEMNAAIAEIWKLWSDSSGKLHETSLNRSNDRSLHDISNYIFNYFSSFDVEQLRQDVGLV